MSRQLERPTALPGDEASQSADAAARAAGVVVRELSDFSELDQAMRLFGRVWGRDANPPLNLELLRALAKAGNYVGGAFQGDRLVGACSGFFHSPHEDALHSHIACVEPGLPGRGVGFALKLHQRAWTLLRGVSTIVWTYDPLVSRNAYFNIAKLGARPVEYLPDFYGPMLDSINVGGQTDRLLVHWQLLAPQVVRAASGTPASALAAEALAAGARVLLGVGEDGGPERRPPGPGHGTSLVAAPTDVERLRGERPDLAGQWRFAVREELSRLMDGGATVVGFDKQGWYVVEEGA